MTEQNVYSLLMTEEFDIDKFNDVAAIDDLINVMNNIDTTTDKNEAHIDAGNTSKKIC